MNSGGAEVRAGHGELVEPLNDWKDLNHSTPVDNLNCAMVWGVL
jgi:hypothetical protein